jgi:hypothetical protein
MALQMEQGFSGYIAKFGEFDGTETIFARLETRQIVKWRFFVFDRPLISQFLIGLKVLVHKSPVYASEIASSLQLNKLIVF